MSKPFTYEISTNSVQLGVDAMKVILSKSIVRDAIFTVCLEQYSRINITLGVRNQSFVFSVALNGKNGDKEIDAIQKEIADLIDKLF